MNTSKVLLFVLLIFLTNKQLISQASNCNISPTLGDVTNELDSLGNIPASQGMVDRERNIWDLIRYQDKIFIGYGSTNTNAGPIPLWNVDVNNNFSFEQVINAEAIERFRIYNNTLLVPNSDPLGGTDDMTKLATRTALGAWTEHSWTPSLAHTRDVVLFNNEYYCMGNSWSPSANAGIYSGIHVANTSFTSRSINLITSELNSVPDRSRNHNWFYGAFTFQDTLVLPNAYLTKAFNPNLALPHSMAFIKTLNKLEWTYNMPPNTQIKHNHLYPVDVTITNPPNRDTLVIMRPFESVEYANKLLVSYRTVANVNSDVNSPYIINYNNSGGMICKSHLKDEAQFITFPDANAVGEDMFVQNGTLYVLTNTKNGSGNFTVRVYRTNNPSLSPGAWVETLRFNSTNRARSFEFLEGFLYFGLGNDYDEITNHTGELMRVKVDCSNVNCSTLGQPCDDGNICTTNDVYDSNCNCYGTVADADGDGICDALDCVPFLFVDDTMITYNNEFTPQNILESNAQLNTPFHTLYTAEDHIELQAGFDSRTATFTADIKPCN